MSFLKKEILVLFRIVASCLTSAVLIFFISSLSGEDLVDNNDAIKGSQALIDQINDELEDGIDQRVKQLGEVPEKNPFRKFYSIELAKEIHDLSNLTEKQRMMFDAYNVRSFEVQLKRMMEYTDKSDVKSLMDELEVVKRELKNSANLIAKKRDRLIRQRTAYIVLFFVFWVILYLYYSRGTLFRRSQYE
jgi:Fe2+ transport system protein B